jgi:hypothetical protein
VRPCCNPDEVISFANLLTSAQEHYDANQRHYAYAVDCLQEFRARGWLEQMTVERITAVVDSLLHHQSEWAASEARLSVLSHFAGWGMAHADR